MRKEKTDDELWRKSCLHQSRRTEKRDCSGTGKYEGADEAAWKSPGWTEVCSRSGNQRKRVCDRISVFRFIRCRLSCGKIHFPGCLFLQRENGSKRRACQQREICSICDKDRGSDRWDRKRRQTASVSIWNWNSSRISLFSGWEMRSCINGSWYGRWSGCHQHYPYHSSFHSGIHQHGSYGISWKYPGRDSRKKGRHH